ncbi:hypothetical protein ACHAWU_003777 [Discostella pseudostelligera]|uniref:t-SNARE coiled-coil homology domain-containing protein n=1 Tax=Discostella pseudostelligera TaxID=259834 RepID=A0ABD3MRQ0_9STRA
MAAAVIPTLGSPPPLHNGPQHLQHQHHQSPWTSHSVNRSTEFLSAARTAFKILQQQQHSRQQQLQSGGGNGNIPNDTQQLLPEWMANLNPMELKLYQTSSSSYHNETDHNDTDNALSLIRDSQTLLQLLDAHLAELHTLVRRRGHTNDPTLEIQSLMEKFQESAREVKDVCDSLRLAGTRPYYNNYNGGTRSAASSSHRRKHYEMLSQQLESLAKERTDQLKLELETRSQVLRDQSHRRKFLASGAGGVGGPAAANSISSGSNAMSASLGTRRMQPLTRLPAQNTVALNAASQFQSPLFTATVGGSAATMNASASTTNNNAYAGYAGSSATAIPLVSTTSATSIGGQVGYAGYGGTLSPPPSFATGMRQRKQQNSHPSPYQMQSQQQSTQPKSHIQIDNGNEDNGYNEKYNKSSSSMTQQISMRREQRATHMRAQQARLAEKSIAELGVMFHKMSSLIVQQGETLERIEDDVESAGLDIDAGHDELVKVYGMTKGNRGLILKVFGVLIFLIIFMKLY